MTALRNLLAFLGLAAPLLDSGVCRCGHQEAGHEHLYPENRHCGTCGRDRCPTYRAIRVADPDLPRLVEIAWRHAVHGRRTACDMTACDVQRRGGLPLLVVVTCARALDARPDIVTRTQVLDDIDTIGWPAWLITAHTLGEHRLIARQLRRMQPAEQRRIAVDLLRYATTRDGRDLPDEVADHEAERVADEWWGRM